MIIIKNLVKSFNGDQVLKGIDLTAEKGELIALLGSSGSGKTTLFRCLTLRETWDEGELTYNGEKVDTKSLIGKLRIRRDIAFLEQKPNLNKNRSALKNVLAGRLLQTPLWRLLGATEHMDAMDVLEKVGLLDKARVKTDKLSGGEQQRVAIAKALAQGAKVIVADEPVSGLDPNSAARVMEDLQNLCRTQRIIVICALHQIELAEKYASRIVGLADGRIAINVRGRRLTQREKDQVV